MNLLLACLFLVGVVVFILFFSYNTLRLWIVVAKRFPKRKFVLGLLIGLILIATLPITIYRADYAIRSTIIGRKMRVVIGNLEQYQGEEPWRACSTCPYEIGTTFGWFVWDWAYLEVSPTVSALFILVAFDRPDDLEPHIWLSLYYYPGFRQFTSDIERLFPEVKIYFPTTGPNLGPMVYRGKKYPVVPSDYISLRIDQGKYEWVELSYLEVDRAVGESMIITSSLFTGPTVHRGFAEKRITLLPWHGRVNWERVLEAIFEWITWPED